MSLRALIQAVSTLVALGVSTSLVAAPLLASKAELDQQQDAAVAQQEAVAWLEKMGDAISQQAYHGTFIYMRGSRFDTVEVTHQFANGEEFERLKNVSGAQREIVRMGEHAVCLHAEEGSSAPHTLPRGPFTHTFNRRLSENLTNYKLGMHGIGRIANRSAVRISISPKNRDRYGYRLWLDEETGLLLRSNLVNNGKLLELFQFTDVTIGEELDPAMLTATIDGEQGYQHDLLTPDQVAQLEIPSAPTWKVNWMPRGFRQVRAPNDSGMVFTDGVATLSIYVEKRTVSSLGSVQTQVGGTVVLSRPIKNSAEQITVVGEVPFATAERIAESVEPVIY